MVETTPRDVAWRAVLEHLESHDSIKSTELDLEPEQQRTALRVLRSMDEMGLVYKETPAAQTWYPTDKLAGVSVSPE